MHVKAANDAKVQNHYKAISHVFSKSTLLTVGADGGGSSSKCYSWRRNDTEYELFEIDQLKPVSYTHLTLPTIYSV